MKRITFILFILLSGIFIACDLHPDDPAELNNEEHVIISTVLDSIRYHYSPTNVDVFDQTSTNINCASLNIAFERDSIDADSLINNYFNANRIRYSLNIDKLPDYVILKDTDESDIYTGYLAFSRPGISEDGLLAVVEYHSISAPLAGSGSAVLLEKRGSVWVIIWHEMMWIS